MPQVEKLLVFVASPGDVLRERHYIEEVIGSLNHTVAPAKGVILQAIRWEKDAFPGYGADAQALINAQIAEMAKYALFVGIMWNRLGTPTLRSDSGTVEEFERAVAAFSQTGQPEIWFYFRESASKLNTDEQLEQRRKVLAFQKRVQANGMPWTYTNPSDLREKFRNQLTLWLNARSFEQNTPQQLQVKIPPLPSGHPEVHYGLIELDEHLNIAGGLRALEIAVDEMLEELRMQRSPKIVINIAQLSEAKASLVALESKGINSMEDREEAFRLRQQIRRFTVWGQPIDQLLSEIVLSVIQNIHQRRWAFLSVSEATRCIMSCFCSFSDQQAATTGSKFDIFRENDKGYWSFGIYLDDGELDDLVKTSGAPGPEFLVSVWGLKVFDFRRAIIVEQILPGMISEYIWLKYASSGDTPSEDEYFSISKWKAGLG